jgi:Arc/MetJ-type ribon-helix-helix transcriptional regulator
MEEFRDLIYGQGEWKNMQEVIRKTFHYCLEKQKEQAQQITEMNNHISKLREELTRRPTWTDVENALAMKSSIDQSSGMMSTSRITNPNDITSMKLEIAKIKSECEKKVSIMIFQTILEKLAEKKDVQYIKEVANRMEEIAKEFGTWKLDLIELKTKTETITEELESLVKSYDVKNSITDLSIVKIQLEGLFRRVHEDIYNKEEIQTFLASKVFFYKSFYI